MTKDHKVQITIAIISLLGVIITALFANWNKIFPSDSKVQTEAVGELVKDRIAQVVNDRSSIQSLIAASNYDLSNYQRNYFTQNGACEVIVHEQLSAIKASVSEDKKNIHIAYSCNRPDHQYECGGSWFGPTTASYSGKVTAKSTVNHGFLRINNIVDHDNNEERSCGNIIVEYLRSLDGVSL